MVISLLCCCYRNGSIERGCGCCYQHNNPNLTSTISSISTYVILYHVYYCAGFSVAAVTSSFCFCLYRVCSFLPLYYQWGATIIRHPRHEVSVNHPKAQIILKIKKWVTKTPFTWPSSPSKQNAMKVSNPSHILSPFSRVIC